MKAMWAAASGMKSLQIKIDTIGNNLSNVSTYGFKKQRVEFKDLMYDKITPNDFKDGEGRPVPIETGHGVMPTATTRSFTKGNFEQTGNDLDVAVNGEGFFVIKDGLGKERYSKDGAFKLSIQDGIAKLVTSDGYAVQGSDGDIILGENLDKFTIAKNGTITVKRRGEETSEEVGSINIVRFANPMGLEAVGSNLFMKSAASGEPINNEDGESGEVWQGFIENSNVQVVDEMISMISAQRAYELNSKTIHTADSLLELAANLKR